MKKAEKIPVKYDPAKFESKWQKKWAKSKIYRSKEDAKKDKFYVLDMFPYPSGEGLHVGHPKGYIATDIISRMNRMQGKNVLHPMGFDAFGLPAENYALKMKKNPMDLTEVNVNRFKKQLELIGLDYDWSREVNTTDPEYYKWTQWAFLQMYKKGLAFESFEPINWCPSCKTGLANEDVEDGRCERCGTPVEKKPLRQWVLKITDYAERLLADLDAKKADGNTLLDWPNSIKEAQKKWIGKSEGAEIEFKISNSDKKIKVFTTRPDTLFGVTYVVLAPEHALVGELMNSVSNNNEIEAYVAQSKLESEIERTDAKKEKTGVELKGVKVINPANNEEVPVWIADYVLADYGTGAVMAVPAHDDRDYAFAKKFGLSIKQVIVPEFGNHADNEQFADGGCSIVFDPTAQRYAVTQDEKGFFRLPSGGIKPGEDPKTCIIRETEEESGLYDFKSIESLGEVNAHYHNSLKNINRVAHATCLLIVANSTKTKPVQLEDHEKKFVLKWVTPDEATANWQTRTDRGADHWIYLMGQAAGRLVELGIDKTSDKNKYKTSSFTGSGMLTNSGSFSGKSSDSVRKDITLSVGGKWVTKFKLRDWVFSRQRYWGEPIPLIHCEKCGVVPVPEKDLPVKLPKVKSYEPTGTGESPLAAIEKWVNVKCPKCRGKAKRETNTMPQWAGSSWYYLRYMDPKNKKSLVDLKKEKYWAPVDLYVGGAEHATRHLIYARFWHKFLYDIGVVSTIEPFIKLQSVGLIMGEDGRKMSKRFGNVVNPDEVIKNYGADSLRLYEMFMGPFDQQISWSTTNMVGVRRFIEKVWRMAEKCSSFNDQLSIESQLINKVLHKAIKKVTADIQVLGFNTAISTLMITVNDIEKELVNNEAVGEAAIYKEQFEILLKLLAPFAPHATEELWHNLGNKKSIHISDWPVCDEKLIIDDEVNIMVQVNGKVRASFKVQKDAAENILESTAKEIPDVKKWLEGKSVKKVIVIKNKLVSIVAV